MGAAAVKAAWIGVRSLSVSPRVAARIAAIAVLGLIGLGTLMSLGAYRLSLSAPEWWRTVNAASPATIELAERTERSLSSALHRGRTLGEPWTVSLSVTQANAWLNVMLPRWLDHREIEPPAWASEAQMQFSTGWVGAGVKTTDQRGRTRYVTLRAEPLIDDGGALWLRPVGATVGRLQVPLRWTFEELERRSAGDGALLAGALMGVRPVAEAAEVPLSDGRVVRVLDVRCRAGKLLLTCVTERAAH